MKLYKSILYYYNILLQHGHKTPDSRTFQLKMTFFLSETLYDLYNMRDF